MYSVLVAFPSSHAQRRSVDTSGVPWCGFVIKTGKKPKMGHDKRSLEQRL